MRHSATAFVVSCEHASNRVPRELRRAFRGRSRQLAGHEGYDRGALEFARALARELNAPLFAGTVSRLVVDLNRSRHHPALVSPHIRRLPEAQKTMLLAAYYFPYRQAIQAEIARGIGRGDRACHFSCHTFTPVRDGVRRNAEIALLYDPSRTWEREICAKLHASLVETGLRVRRNYPYRGVADGLTTHLRRAIPGAVYAGIEIEINQSLLRAGWPRLWRELVHRFAETVLRCAAPRERQAGPAKSCLPGRD